MGGLRTEFDFVLPKGLVDDEGTLHREGTMRLATARDELEPLRDPKVRDADDPYLTVIVLSRVITSLGTKSRVTPRDIEGLFAADLAYLQDFYSVVNFGTDEEIDALVSSVDQALRAPAGRQGAAPSLVEPEPVDAFEAEMDLEEMEMDEEDSEPQEFTMSTRRSRIEEVKRPRGPEASANA
jgi:hypothetical protein